MTNSIPEWLEPLAATLTQERFTGPEWIFEREQGFKTWDAYDRQNGADVRCGGQDHLAVATQGSDPRIVSTIEISILYEHPGPNPPRREMRTSATAA